MKNQQNTTSTQAKKEKAVLVFVRFDDKANHKMELAELTSLAQAMDIEVVGYIEQNRKKPDVAYLIGSGKVEELKQLVEDTEANLVIFDSELSGSKLNNLEKALDIRVIDRSMLILNIFAQRAKTNEGKLQAELAQLKYSLPRLSGLQNSEGRFGGGIGMRGPGETKLELSKRVIEKKILEKQRELDKKKESREFNRSKRVSSSKKTVAIIGYTNAGKSTLMKLITKTDVLTKDMLFATLDTTTRSVWLGEGKEILLVDTVGFVSKLPHEFIEAFSATLEESVHADLLLHIIDASNPLYKEQEEVVMQVLKKLKVDTTPLIKVYNKIDKAPGFLKKPKKDSVYISALKNEGIESLKQKIIDFL